jgi:hypothetical protein
MTKPLQDEDEMAAYDAVCEVLLAEANDFGCSVASAALQARDYQPTDAEVAEARVMMIAAYGALLRHRGAPEAMIEYPMKAAVGAFDEIITNNRNLAPGYLQ